jgi:hypothetical protein
MFFLLKNQKVKNKKFFIHFKFFLLLDQDEQAKIETLHKKRNLLAAYCKLIVHNVLPIQAATNILKYYVKVNFSYIIFIEKILGLFFLVQQ